ncbi:MAG: type II secretion system F family protein [Candidatus Omnitrophica bacterium]|nr:type II secretion system F family protein [Candidatus Omnitrophota bacterium]
MGKIDIDISGLFASQRSGVKIDEIVVFTERLSAMINAGLPIIKCLQTMKEQSDNTVLKNILYGICLDLEGGLKFSEALAKYPRVFSQFYVNLVLAGETGGIIDEVLIRISSYLSKEQELRRDIQKAFAYPVIVLSAAVLVIGFLTMFIVPVFADVYSKMGVTLPLPTVILLGISKVVGKYWWLIGVLVGVGWFAGSKIRTTERGGLFIDNLKLKVPIFGTLNRQVAVTQVLRTLASLVSSGVPLIEALDTVRDLSGNKVVSKIMDDLKENVEEGAKIADSLEEVDFFPPMVVQMISAGEEAGALETMLSKSADFLDRDIDYTIKKLVTRLEPILTTILAVVVGFIAMAIYLPMFDVVTGLNK